MEFSKLKLDLVFVPLSAFGLYAGLTTQHKIWFDWFGIACSSFYLASFLLRPYLKGMKGKTSYLKDNTLNIDVGAKKDFRIMIGLGIIVLSMVIFYKFPSKLTIFGFFLAFIGAYMYWNRNLALGVYKNGKYLGNIYKGFIKVGDGFALGKRQGGTIGYLKIKKDGKVVALLTLTPEAFMELKPDKIHEIFPEIRGEVEEFKDLFKVGDYTLQYSLFTRSYRYKGSYGYGYEGGYQSHSFDDNAGDLLTDPAYSFFEGNIYHNDSNDWFFDPTYSFFEGNIFHDTFHDSFHNSFHDH